MTTITLKIDERTKKGKAFLEMARAFENSEGIEIISTSDSEMENYYNPEFVAMIKQSENEIKEGKTTTINPKDIWGSLGLK